MGSITIKKYFKSPILLVSTVVFFSYMFFWLIRVRQYLPVNAISQVLHTQEISFLFFLFVSYEFLVKAKKDNCEELLGSIKHAKLKDIMCALIWLILEMIILCIGIFTVLYETGENTMAYIEYTVKFVGIHYFLLNVLAIVVGAIFSVIFKPIHAYTGMLVLYMLFSSKIISSIQQLSYGKEILYRFSDLLSVYSRDFSAMGDSYYLYSVEFVNVERILIFLGIFLSLFLLVRQNGWKKITAMGPVVFTIVCIVLFFKPTSAVNLDNGVSGQDALTADDTYYRASNDCMDETQYSTPKFQVSSYKAKFQIDRQLHAQVTVELKENRNSQCEFTLYHGYKIKKIQDQNGKAVHYEQKGDYITIDENASKYTFFYDGYCKRYYSTSQGAFLPGYFSYYPMPGKRRIYWIADGYWGNALEGLGYCVNFDVTINTNTKVACNLEQKGDRHFVGKSDGMTIFASNFLDRVSFGKYTIVLSRLSEEYATLEENRECYQKKKKKYQNKGQKVKTIFIPPYLNGTMYYFGKDHVIGTVDTLEYYYNIYKTTGYLYDFISNDELSGLIGDENND